MDSWVCDSDLQVIQGVRVSLSPPEAAAVGMTLAAYFSALRKHSSAD